MIVPLEIWSWGQLVYPYRLIFNGENTLFTKVLKNGLVSEKNTLFFPIIGGSRTIYGIFHNLFKFFFEPSLTEQAVS